MIVWRRPRSCDTNACPCVAFDGEHVLICSTLEPERIVRFTRDEWADLVAGIKEGEFDVEEG